MARRSLWGVALACVAVPALSGPAAQGGVVTVNFWDARAGYGVFADDGAAPAPDQGLEILGLGAFSTTWQQSDGVAHARARVDSVITLNQDAGGLDFRAELGASASAIVGTNPAYTFGHASATAFLDSLVLDLTLHRAATLEITGATLGGYAPGVHALEAGRYLLDLDGPRAWAEAQAWAGQSATGAGSFEVGARIVPGVGGVWVLGVAGVRPRRGRARMKSSATCADR